MKPYLKNKIKKKRTRGVCGSSGRMLAYQAGGSEFNSQYENKRDRAREGGRERGRLWPTGTVPSSWARVAL
jgi:hypothetical protein